MAVREVRLVRAAAPSGGVLRVCTVLTREQLWVTVRSPAHVGITDGDLELARCIDAAARRHLQAP